MRDIKEMAREVKLPYDYISGEPLYPEKLKAFAELVRADERERVLKILDDQGTWAHIGDLVELVKENT